MMSDAINEARRSVTWSAALTVWLTVLVYVPALRGEMVRLKGDAAGRCGNVQFAWQALAKRQERRT